MDIKENISLKNYSTMRLGGTARFLTELSTEEEVPKLVAWINQKSLPCLIIGQGANIIWRDKGFDGLVIANRIKGMTIITQDEASATVRISGGENWDDVVAWSVKQGWSSIEFLSLIPGTAGAAPVQNIGAYGAELAETLVEVEAFDTKTGAFGGITAANCSFAYRTSRFKTTDRGRFFITGIVLKLKKTNPTPPFYETLGTYLKEHEITEYSPATIRDAVIAIRSAKLPDPQKVANNGSFFVNPIVSQNEAEAIQQKFTDIKSWTQADGKVKLSAAWMIEKAGLKDYHDPETGMATWPRQAMTLINEHAKSTDDVLAFKQKIVDKVEQMFGVTLQQEPELLP